MTTFCLAPPTPPPHPHGEAYAEAVSLRNNANALMRVMYEVDNLRKAEESNLSEADKVSYDKALAHLFILCDKRCQRAADLSRIPKSDLPRARLLR